MSHIIGFAPVAVIAWKEATYVIDGTNTSSPYPMPQACNARCKAAVPLVVATQYLDLKIFEKLELPLLEVLGDMELQGMALNKSHLQKLSQRIHLLLIEQEKEIYELAGEQFNINSPKQLSVILFEKLELPVIKKTKTGYSTDVSVLEELSTEHELPEVILLYRQLAKLKSTYVDALQEEIFGKTVRVHTSFNQSVAATGRLSSSNPNLQNIPIRTEMGREIRKAFIAEKNNKILSADYS